MKRTFLLSTVIFCTSALSAQDNSELVGEYAITEFCKEVAVYHIGYERTNSVKIVHDPTNGDLLLTGITDSLKIESVGDGFFSINTQYFINYDSTQMNVSGFGVVKNNDIYLYYNSGGSSGVINCICVGTRKTTTGISPTNSKQYLSEPYAGHMLGEYAITVFSKELAGDKKASEYESNIKITSDGNEPFLSGIANQLKIEPADSNFFLIGQQEFGSAKLSVGGFGMVKNDTIYLYYYKNEDSGTTKCIGIGTRTHATGFNQASRTVTTAELFQNTPNPFSYQTEIKYYLPDNSNNAVLSVFSLNGKLMFSKQLTPKGIGSITVNGSELEAGTYIYTLLVNGVEVDSKRMILTK